MEFSIGDMIMHPQFGPARVTGLEDREWVEGFKRYCVLEVLTHSMTLHVPVGQFSALGLRPIMSQANVAQVMHTLGGVAKPLSEDARERQQELLERIQMCKPLEMASVIRDLTWRQRDAHLTKRDIDLMDRARHLLAAEIASATGSKVEPVEQAIGAAMAQAIARSLPEVSQNT